MSLAHEFGHFLDHCLAVVTSVRSTHLSDATDVDVGPIALAMNRVLATMTKRTRRERVSSQTARRWYRKHFVMSAIEAHGGSPQKALDFISAEQPRRFREGRNARKNQVTLVESMGKWLGHPVTVEITYHQNTEFYDGARKLGAYWKRHHELFARAFESFVEDQLVASGRESPYLVTGTRLDYANCRGAPYPKGAERRVINEAISKLLAVVQAELGLERNADLRLGHPR